MVLNIVFVPEIPSDKCSPFDGKTTIRQGQHDLLLKITDAWNLFQPRKFTVTVDRLVSIKALKQILSTSHIPDEFLILCDDELVVLESTTVAASMKTSEERQKPRAVKVLSDQQPVSDIGCNSVVYVYATCHTHRELALVHMVCLLLLSIFC
jgi:hypothetical protein